MSPAPLFVCPDTPAGAPSDYGGVYQVIGFPAITPFLVVAPHMVPVRRPKPDARPISEPEPSPLRLYRGYLEALMSPDPFRPLVAHPPAFSPQKSCHAAVAVPPVGPCSEGRCAAAADCRVSAGMPVTIPYPPADYVNKASMGLIAHPAGVPLGGG